MFNMTVLVRPELRRQLLTPDEVADVLRVSSGTVRRHLVSGEIRGVRVGSGPKAPWRIPSTELDRLSGTETQA